MDQHTTRESNQHVHSRRGASATFGVAVLALGVIALAGVQLLRGGVAPTPSAFQDGHSLKEAMALAGERDMRVVAVASATWCPPCQSYKKNTLSKPAVAEWMAESVIPVYIDVDEQRDAARLLNVSSIPATYVLDESGVIAGRVGPMSENELISFVEGAAR